MFNLNLRKLQRILLSVYREKDMLKKTLPGGSHHFQKARVHRGDNPLKTKNATVCDSL